jgi:hypothetical protein
VPGPDARWWAIRRAQSLKPATYRCPLCGGLLHAMSEHLLIAPEGDSARRRHAHSACVLAARDRGRLLTLDEWRAGESTDASRFLSGVRRRLRS